MPPSIENGGGKNPGPVYESKRSGMGCMYKQGINYVLMMHCDFKTGCFK